MRSNVRGWGRLLPLAMAVPCVALGWWAIRSPRVAEATPAYARRYGVECQTCHAPNAGRLNNVGLVFRRSGFRMLDTDDKGNMTLKDAHANTIGDAMAIAGQLDGALVQNPDPGASKSSFELSEVELIAGTSFGDHYSAQMLFIPYDDAGEAALENAEFQANYGQPGSQVIVRGGKITPLVWQKAGHGSMTLSSPLILGETSPGAVGDFAGPGLATNQAGVEAGYMATRLEKGKLLAGMVSVAALNGFMPDGSDARTHNGDGVDVLAQGTLLVGSSNTANVWYYDGHTLLPPDLGAGLPNPFRRSFTRYGASGSVAPIERIEVVGGLGAGTDKSDELGRTVKTLGWYGEVTGEIAPRWTATYRYDSVDPDTDTGGDLISDHVIGMNYLLHDSVYSFLEYQQVQIGDTKTHTISARVRVLY